MIVAINEEENAPIFQMVGYAFIGDLIQIVSELQSEIAKAKG